MAEELDLDRKLRPRRIAGGVAIVLGALILTAGLWLSGHVPPDEHPAARGAAQVKAFSCLGLGGLGVLVGVVLAFGSPRRARVLYVDDELRATANVRGVRRALKEAALAQTQLDPKSRPSQPE